MQPAPRIAPYTEKISATPPESDPAAQFAGLAALRTLAVAPETADTAAGAHRVGSPSGTLRRWVSRAWAHQFRLVIFAVDSMNVLAVGLLIQVLLVRYENMSHVTSYIAQAVTSVQLSFLLSRYISCRDRDMRVIRALARFNVRQLGVAGVGMAGYAWLDHLGMNYIAANVAVTAALAPLSFLAHHGWPLSRSAYSRRRAGRLRRARELMVIAVVGMAIGGGLYVLGSYSILLVLFVTNLFNLTVASLEARWRFYALRNPEAAEQLTWPAPIKPGHERISFSSIVCALDEADAIGATLEGLVRQTHRRHQIIVSLRDHDTPTIAAVRDFQLAHPGAIDLIVGHYEAAGKHAQLNGALRYCTGDYIGPIDSEDDVAPELLVHVESLIRRTDADIVQGGVQLMNLGRTWQEWYKVHNVEEYRAWYSSRMAFQVSAGFVPLGGNTVYTRARLLRETGGWPESPTEDCAAGVLMCTKFGAKVVAAYSPELATKEEVPGAVFDKEIGSLFWQRVRWLQGIFQELIGGVWLRMPTLRQKLLAGYILATPVLQAFSCALVPVAILSAFVIKMPVGLAMFMFTPLIPMALTIVSMLAGVRSFGQDYGQKIRIRHYASILFMTPVYQVILAMAAMVAVAKYLRGDKGWYKTARLNEHRAQGPARPGTPASTLPRTAA